MAAESGAPKRPKATRASTARRAALATGPASAPARRSAATATATTLADSPPLLLDIHDLLCWLLSSLEREVKLLTVAYGVSATA